MADIERRRYTKADVDAAYDAGFEDGRDISRGRERVSKRGRNFRMTQRDIDAAVKLLDEVARGTGRQKDGYCQTKFI